jgi:hypothetical protein
MHGPRLHPIASVGLNFVLPMVPVPGLGRFQQGSGHLLRRGMADLLWFHLGKYSTTF